MAFFKSEKPTSSKQPSGAKKPTPEEQMLLDSLAALRESEEVANETMANLKRQKEQLKNIKNGAHDVNNGLNQSNKTLNKMEKDSHCLVM